MTHSLSGWDFGFCCMFHVNKLIYVFNLMTLLFSILFTMHFRTQMLVFSFFPVYVWVELHVPITWTGMKNENHFR